MVSHIGPVALPCRRDHSQPDLSGGRTLWCDFIELGQDRPDLLRALCRQYVWSRFLTDVETTDMSACCPSVSVQGERDGCVVLDSIITCPHCGRTKSERMPVDA